MRLDVLHVPDCPNLAALLDRLGEITDQPVTTHEITDQAEAIARGMTGSPTLLVDGTDPFAAPDLAPGFACRIYRDERGRITPAPTVDQLRAAIQAPRPSVTLTASRSRTLPRDPIRRAVHRAILRSFAATGRPPARDDLVTGASERELDAILTELHESDAIRLAPDGGIAVAYPFSAAPTRHRVRIADRVDVHAMCAVDALGISAMLGEDTRIESVDATSGRPVTVTIRAGRATWAPAGAVVFVGATGAGPSADCCCDYLNFFTDPETAEAWVSAHPDIPGEVLTQEQALTLGRNLFGQLLEEQ